MQDVLIALLARRDHERAAGEVNTTGAGEDNGIDHHKN
jgi:hypothetical protein